MKENARRGYSNGGIIPFGYRSVDAEIIGTKQKKRLEIEPVEAETVRLIFRLALEGDGTSGPIGTKKIACWLNEHGYRTRGGSLFGTGTVHEILTRAAYAGIRLFNEYDRDSERKATSEIIEYEVPVIIDRSIFDAVQAHLVARQPRARGTRLILRTVAVGRVGSVRLPGIMRIEHGDRDIKERYDICVLQMHPGYKTRAS